MKTQISRVSRQPDKRYSGVYQQQGRMLTDADWNEASDLDKQRLWDALRDAIGNGAPRAGGLVVNADRTLQPGALYVDGVAARLPGTGPIAYASQPDFVAPPALPAGDFVLYADVWERTVTSHEDPALVDAGLHGADTCTRTQTMLQVKWSPSGVDPEDPAANPPVGDGRLKAKLHQVSTGGDLCDPCAADIDIDERVGNYLFRVEVHDVYQQGGHTFLVLKWSRDNGAEQFAVAGAPADFQEGDWTFEFFDDASEKRLGVHLAPSYVPRRGELVTGYTVPTAAATPKTYVRQWDGHCVLNLTTHTLVSGHDLRIPLTATGSETAPGHVTIETSAAAASVSLNLDLLELSLELRQDSVDRVFVAGDYWLSVVREAVHTSGQYVLGDADAGEAPGGVRHRYLKLASFDGAGALVAETDAQRRRFHFPPLPDLQAADVGLVNNCAGLFAGAENVQQALDALCGIAADDIAWTPPTCPAPSVASLLAATTGWNWAAQDGDAGHVTVNDALTALLCKLDAAGVPYTAGTCGATGAATVRSLLGLAPGSHTVAQALDALLCDLRANDLPLDKSSSICSTLDDAGIVTVQDALKALCDRPADGCAQTIRTAAELTAALTSTAVNLELCLLPGTYALGALSLAGKGSIQIKGGGASASIIQLTGASTAIQANELHFEGLGFVVTQSGGSLNLTANRLSVERCSFRRNGATAAVLPMVEVSPTGLAATSTWRDAELVSRFFRFDRSSFDSLVPPATALGERFPAIRARLLAAATKPDLLGDPLAFEDEMRAVGSLIRNLSPEERRTWAQRVGSSRGAAKVSIGNQPGELWSWAFESQPAAAVLREALQQLLLKARPTLQDGRLAATFVIAAAVTAGFTPALQHASVAMDLTLVDSRCDGEALVVCQAQTPAAASVNLLDLGLSNTVGTVAANPWLTPAAGKLEVRGNRLHRLSFVVDSTLVTVRQPLAPNELSQAIPAFARAAVSQNLITAGPSSLVADSVACDGNSFARAGTSLLIIGNRSTFVGNSGAASAPLTCRQRNATNGFGQAANVLVTVSSL